jgi:hypothetical protein
MAGQHIYDEPAFFAASQRMREAEAGILFQASGFAGGR